MILVAPFDPITNKEIEIIKTYLKKYKKVFLYVEEKGEIPKAIRIKLIKLATKNFRHIYLTDESKGINIDSDDELKVRNGNYQLAANGIKKELIINGYYYTYLVKRMCSEYRYNHSISVANTARSLAKYYGLNEKYAYNIGLLHDITKDLPLEENQELLKDNKEALNYSSKVWHSFSAPIWLKKNLGIKDTRFLNAICRHTLGDTKTKYDEIVYVADKIEPLRTYDVTVETKLAYQDIKKAVELIKKETKEILAKRGENNE